MRTLKKTLCLVLALVMVLGLCAINAAAADFTDADEIEYTESVNVMKLVKVLEGNPDGSFDPKGTLTRAQACTIIAKLMGFGDIAGTTTFTDTQGHWAESWIAFCEAEGIVGGVGNGLFDPEGTLTGSQWAKMVLCATGYNAKKEGFGSGDTGWEIAVAKLVKKTEIADTIDGFDGTAPISREEACELAFYAAQLNTRTFTPGMQIEGTGLSITDSGKYDTIAGTPLLTNLLSAAKITRETTNPDPDDYGRPASATYKNAKGVIVYSESIAPVATYTKGFTAKELTALKKTYTTWCNNTKIFVNGQAASTMGASAIADVDALAAREYTGTTIELYGSAAAKKITDIVVVQEYLTKVTDLKATGSSKYIKLAVYNPWASGDVVNVTINDNTTSTTDEFDILSASYAKGDYLLTVWEGADAAAGKLIEAKDVDTVEDVTITNVKLSATTFDGTVTAGGATYTAASGYAEATGVGGALTPSKTAKVTLYLDSNGYLIGVVGAATAAAKYGVVTGVMSATDYDGTTYTVRVLTAAGETEELVVASAKNTGDGSPWTPAAKSLVKYSESSTAGKYDLVFQGAVTTSGTTAISSDSATITLNGTTKTANAKTVFFVHTVVSDKDVFKVYTGIANAPKITAGNCKCIDTDGLATVVYIDTATVDTSSASKDVIYIAVASEDFSNDLDLGKYNEYNAVVNGKITTVRLSVNESNATNAENFDSSNYIYTASSVNSTTGTITALTKATDAGTTDYEFNVAKTYEFVDGSGTITFGSATVLVDDNSVIYMVDKAGEITLSSLDEITEDANDTVCYYTVKGVLVAAFIQEV